MSHIDIRLNSRESLASYSASSGPFLLKIHKFNLPKSLNKILRQLCEEKVIEEEEKDSTDCGLCSPYNETDSHSHHYDQLV